MPLKGPQVSWKAVLGYWVWREELEATDVTWGHRVHTYRLVLPSFQQSVQAASLARGQLKRQFLNPADGSGYGLLRHRNSTFLPFHRPLGNPERNHTGCRRVMGNLAVSPQSQSCEQQAT